MSKIKQSLIFLLSFYKKMPIYLTMIATFFNRLVLICFYVLLSGCFIDSRVLHLYPDPGAELRNPEIIPPGPSEPLPDNDNPGDHSFTSTNAELYLANINFGSTSGYASTIVSPDRTYKITIVDLTGDGRRHMVKVPLSGAAPSIIPLNFVIENSTTISLVKFTPDGSRFLFASNHLAADIANLYITKVDGTEPACLSCPMISGSSVALDHFNGRLLEVTPNNRVVFMANAENSAKFEVYSNNFTGTDRIKLNLPLSGAGTIQKYQMTPDNLGLLYFANHSASTPFNHYWVSVNGGSVVKKNPNGLAGSSTGVVIYSPDASKIAFSSDKDTIGIYEVFVMNADGSNVVKVSQAPISTGDVHPLKFSNDGTRLIYFGDQITENVDELFSVNLDGTGYARLTEPMSSPGNSNFVTFTPDGEKVIYAANVTATNIFDLKIINLDGTGRLNLANNIWRKVSGERAFDPLITFLDANTFIFFCDLNFDTNYEIRRIDTDGTNSSLILNPSVGYQYFMPATFINSAKTRLTSLDRKIGDSNYSRVFSVNLDGSNYRVHQDAQVTGMGISSVDFISDDKLLLGYFENNQSGVLDISTDSLTSLFLDSPAKYFELQFTADSSKMLTRRSAVGSPYNKKEITIDNTQTASSVVIGSGQGVNVSQMLLSPVSNEVFMRGTDSIGEFIFKANLNGTGWTKLNPSTPLDSGFTNMMGFSVSQSRFLYTLETSFKDELFSMNLDGSGNVRVHPAGFDDLEDFLISADGTKVVYWAEQEVNNRNELYSSNVDGSGNTKLNGPLTAGGNVDYYGHKISPDGSKVVYLADQDINDVTGAYVVNINGTNRVSLTPNLSLGRDAQAVAFSPNGQRIVIAGDLETDGILELFSVRVDGTGFQKISGTMVAGGGVYLEYLNDFQFHQNSEYVVFRALKESQTKIELYLAKIDGGEVTKISAPMVNSSGKVQNFQFDSSGQYLVYQMNDVVENTFQIYSYDLLNQNSNRLSRDLSVKESVRDFILVPGKLIYRTQLSTGAELYVINLNGQQHVRVHGDLLPLQSVGRSYYVTPDFQYLFFTLNTNLFHKTNLFKFEL